jgi:hypothetical protein
MSIKNRIQKIEDKVSSGNEFEIAVFITDGFEITMCGVRRDGCPEYPCKQTDCWWKREYPNVKAIKVTGNDNDD